MAKVGQQTEHVGGHPKVVLDASEYQTVEGQPIEPKVTKPEDEKQELALTTSEWPYASVKR